MSPLEMTESWLARLNAGDEAAVERLYRVYEPYLRMILRRRISAGLRQKVDSADIVQSVFADVVVGVRQGGWRFENRAQLQGLLRRIASRRLSDRYTRHHNALQREQSLVGVEANAHPKAHEPQPSQVAQGREFWERVLRACPPEHHEIVRLRLNGARLAEIAQRTGLHEGSVRRILYELARRLAIRPAQDGTASEPGPPA